MTMWNGEVVTSERVSGDVNRILINSVHVNIPEYKICGPVRGMSIKMLCFPSYQHRLKHFEIPRTVLTSPCVTLRLSTTLAAIT
jgi:hypothetical protein